MSARDPQLEVTATRLRHYLTRIASEWRFDSWQDLAAVIRLEFPAELAEQILSEHVGTSVEYYYNLYHRQY